MGRLGNKILNAIGFEEAPVSAYAEGNDGGLASDEPREHMPARKKEKGKVIRMYDAEMKVLIYEPKEYENAQGIAADIERGRQVVVNVDGLENGDAQRIADFVGGAVYAMKGQIQWITPTLFIAVPANVDVETDGGNFETQMEFNW